MFSTTSFSLQHTVRAGQGTHIQLQSGITHPQVHILLIPLGWALAFISTEEAGGQQVGGPCPCPTGSGSWTMCLPAAILLFTQAMSLRVPGAKCVEQSMFILMGFSQDKTRDTEASGWGYRPSPGPSQEASTGGCRAGGGLAWIRDRTGQPASLGILVHLQSLPGPESERLGGRGLIR